MLKTADEKGGDNKILAVPVTKVDPRFDEIKSYEDLPKHVQEELLPLQGNQEARKSEVR